jgi:hypothetical protein
MKSEGNNSRYRPVESNNSRSISSVKDNDNVILSTVSSSSGGILELSSFKCSSQEQKNFTKSDRHAKKMCSKSVTFVDDAQVHTIPRVSRDEKQFYFYSTQELRGIRKEYITELRSEYECFHYQGLFRWNQLAVSFYARFREFLSYHLSTFFSFMDHDTAMSNVNKSNRTDFNMVS